MTSRPASQSPTSQSPAPPLATPAIGHRFRLAALAGFALLGATALAPAPARAATIQCQAATAFSGFRPPARFGNDEVAIAPWDGGMLLWSRDARFRFDPGPGVTLDYRSGDSCRVALTGDTLVAARLPVLPGDALRIEVTLCPVEAGAQAPPCQPSILQFLPR